MEAESTTLESLNVFQNGMEMSEFQTIIDKKYHPLQNVFIQHRN